MSTFEPLVVSTKNAQEIMGIKASKLWDLIKSGEIESYLDGSRRMITMASIRAYITRQLERAQDVRRTVPIPRRNNAA
jgi:hypothetical protein